MWIEWCERVCVCLVWRRTIKLNLSHWNYYNYYYYDDDITIMIMVMNNLWYRVVSCVYVYVYVRECVFVYSVYLLCFVLILILMPSLGLQLTNWGRNLPGFFDFLDLGMHCRGRGVIGYGIVQMGGSPNNKYASWEGIKRFSLRSILKPLNASISHHHTLYQNIHGKTHWIKLNLKPM